MAIQVGIPEAAMITLTDMVDNLAEIEAGMEVLILAHKDGLYGGPNYVDEEAVAWASTVVQSRGARCSVLWIDETPKLHEWRYPPIVKKAVEAADVLINTSSILVTEEIPEFREHLEEVGTWMVRMFPVTKELLMTEWAQTPYELTKMMRHVSSRPFQGNEGDEFKFVMTDPNGTHIEGNTIQPKQRPGIPGHGYASWRRQTSHYLPFPEWVHPPVNCKNVNGIYNFNCMLSWWSPYIGIDPEWEKLISIEVKDTRIVKITGGPEADALSRFLKVMEGKVGDGIYNFDTFHFGIHPNAKVAKYQCPNDLYMRVIDHMHTSNLHVHIGSAPANPNYYFYPHITGDIRNATLVVNGTTVYDKGWLCSQDDPDIKTVVAKYPGRPGIPEKY